MIAARMAFVQARPGEGCVNGAPCLAAWAGRGFAEGFNRSVSRLAHAARHVAQNLCEKSEIGPVEKVLWPKSAGGGDDPARTRPMFNDLRRASAESRRRLGESDYQPKRRNTKFQQSFLSAVLCHRRASFWPVKKSFRWITPAAGAVSHTYNHGGKILVLLLQ